MKTSRHEGGWARPPSALIMKCLSSRRPPAKIRRHAPVMLLPESFRYLHTDVAHSRLQVVHSRDRPTTCFQVSTITLLLVLAQACKAPTIGLRMPCVTPSTRSLLAIPGIVGVFGRLRMSFRGVAGLVPAAIPSKTRDQCIERRTAGCVRSLKLTRALCQAGH